jgi:spore coat protein H
MKNAKWSMLALLFCALFSNCKKDNSVKNSNPDWTTASHDKSATPDYDLVFPQNNVNTLEFTFRKATWDSLLADAQKKYYDIPFGGGFQSIPSNVLQQLQSVGGLNVGLGAPDYFDVHLKFNGKSWNNVGFRLKGTGSLFTSWLRGIYKLPFRLDMNRFADKNPDVANQSFYGFNDLTFAPGFGDNSLIRDKTVSDIFRSAGVKCAQTAFYKIYIDFGDGKKYCGVYTMIESVDDTMIKTQFGDDNGNIYKPESHFDVFDKNAFDKKNNKTANDFTDVKALFDILHDNTRLTNPTVWRTNLEKILNVEDYLKWLALNIVLLNDDNYLHNYYLFNSPTKHLTYIPWDFNDALKYPDPNQPPNQDTSYFLPDLPLSHARDNYPLIKFVKEDAVYFGKYKQYMREFNNNQFTITNLNAMIDKNTNLIAPFINGAEPETLPFSQFVNVADFAGAASDLRQIIQKRRQEVVDFLQ